MTTTTTFTGLQTNRYPGRNPSSPARCRNSSSVTWKPAPNGSSSRSTLSSSRRTGHLDGRSFIVNGSGKLYRLPADGSSGLEQIPIGAVSGVNNDHVLSPDGQRVYFSADGHLYCVDVEGGDARRVSNVHPPEQQYSYWLHGVSPDESTLAYVSVEPEGDEPRARRNLATVPASGGPDHQMTEGVNAYDGPEYSPDGEWLYYNSEEVATTRRPCPDLPDATRRGRT